MKNSSRLISSKTEQLETQLGKFHSDPLYKGAYVISELAVLYRNQKFTKEDSRLTVCRDVIASYPVVIYTRKNFFLLDELNEKIALFKSAGLIGLWQMEDIDRRFLKIKESSNPEPLSVNHLMGSVYLLIMGYLFSLSLFLYEIIKRVK